MIKLFERLFGFDVDSEDGEVQVAYRDRLRRFRDRLPEMGDVVGFSLGVLLPAGLVLFLIFRAVDPSYDRWEKERTKCAKWAALHQVEARFDETLRDCVGRDSKGAFTIQSWNGEIKRLGGKP